MWRSPGKHGVGMALVDGIHIVDVAALYRPAFGEQVFGAETEAPDVFQFFGSEERGSLAWLLSVGPKVIVKSS